MDEISTKALIIGFSIFITVIIVTVIVFEFSEIQKVYKLSAETDITFEERLNEFDKYKDGNNDFRGLDVQNTISKYKGNNTVEVCVETGDKINCSEGITIPGSDYNKKYTSRYEEIGSKSRIIFKLR